MFLLFQGQAEDESCAECGFFFAYYESVVDIDRASVHNLSSNVFLVADECNQIVSKINIRRNLYLRRVT